MRTRSGVIGTVLMVVVIGGTAAAAKALSHQLLAWPGYETQWQKGIGVPDGSKSQQGLLMEKVDPLADTPNGSGVAFFNAEGTTLTQLGYEIKNDGICGVFPRYRVRVPHGDPETRDDDYSYVFECQSGTHTPSYAGWTTVTFSGADAVPTSAGAPAFAFGTEISSLGLLFHLDEGVGFTTLDNLNVNGTPMGKPGR